MLGEGIHSVFEWEYVGRGEETGSAPDFEEVFLASNWRALPVPGLVGFRLHSRSQ